MSNQYSHFVRLKPLGNFFFGGENYADSDRRAFYLQHSEPLPQQTTLLGMLRYQLLLQNKHLQRVAYKNHSQLSVKDEAKAAALIGTHSFEMDGNHSFGVLQRLSPVFLCRNNTPYFAFSKVKYFKSREDRNNGRYELHSPRLEPVSAKATFSLHDEHEENQLYTLQKYNAKDGFEHGFIALGDDTSFKTADEVFLQDTPHSAHLEQVGIYKAHTLPYRLKEELAEQEGFFKLHYQRMQDDWSFGCYISLQDGTTLEDDTIIMGKERSAFRMEVKELTRPAPLHPPSPQQETRPQAGQSYWLLSDSYLPTRELHQVCEYVLMDTISFRNMRSRLKAPKGQFYNYHGKPRRPGDPYAGSSPTISGRYNFFRKGGLFKLKASATQNDIDDLFTAPGLQKIGYNFFHPINLDA